MQTLRKEVKWLRLNTRCTAKMKLRVAEQAIKNKWKESAALRHIIDAGLTVMEAKEDKST